MEIREVWRYSVRGVSGDLAVDDRIGGGGVTALMLGVWDWIIRDGRGSRE